MSDMRARFEKLREFCERVTAQLEDEIRAGTGIQNFKVFVNDQFEAAFPEDHLMRDGAMFMSLRLAISVKGFGQIDKLKELMAVVENELQVLRCNFADSAEDLAFDWHLAETTPVADASLKLLADVNVLTRRLKELM